MLVYRDVPSTNVGPPDITHTLDYTVSRVGTDNHTVFTLTSTLASTAQSLATDLGLVAELTLEYKDTSNNLVTVTRALAIKPIGTPWLGSESLTKTVVFNVVLSNIGAETIYTIMKTSITDGSAIGAHKMKNSVEAAPITPPTSVELVCPSYSEVDTETLFSITCADLGSEIVSSYTLYANTFNLSGENSEEVYSGALNTAAVNLSEFYNKTDEAISIWAVMHTTTGNTYASAVCYVILRDPVPAPNITNVLPERTAIYHANTLIWEYDHPEIVLSHFELMVANDLKNGTVSEYKLISTIPANTRTCDITLTDEVITGPVAPEGKVYYCIIAVDEYSIRSNLNEQASTIYTGGAVKINKEDTFVSGTLFYKSNGTWVPVEVYIKDTGTWQKGT